MPRIVSGGGILRLAVVLKRAEALGAYRVGFVSFKGPSNVAVVRGFELPEKGRQIVLPGERAKQQRLDLTCPMPLTAPVIIGARIRRVGLPFGAIQHSRPIERDACGFVGS